MNVFCYDATVLPELRDIIDTAKYAQGAADYGCKLFGEITQDDLHAAMIELAEMMPVSDLIEMKPAHLPYHFAGVRLELGISRPRLTIDDVEFYLGNKTRVYWSPGLMTTERK